MAHAMVARLSTSTLTMMWVLIAGPRLSVVSSTSVPFVLRRRLHTRLHPTNFVLPHQSHLIFLRGGSASQNNHTLSQSYRPSSSDVDRQKPDKSNEDIGSGCGAVKIPKKPTSSSAFLRRCNKVVRKSIASLFSGAGFVSSAFFGSDPWKIQKRIREPLLAFQEFMQSSGIDQEVSKAFGNAYLGRNLALLARLQQQRRHQERATNASNARQKDARSTLPRSFWEEAQRYMRYATSVYGQAMIHAAQVDAKGVLDGKWGQVTQEAIARHVGIPQEDVVLMNLDDSPQYEGDSSLHNLKHFVAIDHENKAIVLSIRGTFSIEGIVVDVTAFSREFCGGEGHSEMATMAERVWEVAGPTVQDLLRQNKGYELIVTGHSLGAGTACLLNILVQNKRLLPASQPVRCFAYASPPVFTPLEVVPSSVKTTINFIHQEDAVPFLSIYTVRRLLTQLSVIHDYASDCMTRTQRAKAVLGFSAPPKGLFEAVYGSPLSVMPKQGAPRLEIPATKTIWFKETDDGEAYSYECCSPEDLCHLELHISPNMLIDHFPPRYEHALDHLEELQLK